MYQQVWSRGEINLLDQIMTEDHSQRDMIWLPERLGGGRERMQKGIRNYRKAYPDLEFELDHISVDEDKQRVVVEWTAHATQDVSSGASKPTGHTEKFPGVAILDIQDGQIKESRVYRGAPTREVETIRAKKATTTAA
jgi:ketosteroid isomerase-like protein